MGLGAGSSYMLFFCSEAAFQDDVIAVIALGCKRDTLGILQEEMQDAVAFGSHGRHDTKVPAEALPPWILAETNKISLHRATHADKSRDFSACLPICLVEYFLATGLSTTPRGPTTKGPMCKEALDKLVLLEFWPQALKGRFREQCRGEWPHHGSGLWPGQRAFILALHALNCAWSPRGRHSWSFLSPGKQFPRHPPQMAPSPYLKPQCTRPADPTAGFHACSSCRPHLRRTQMHLTSTQPWVHGEHVSWPGFSFWKWLWGHLTSSHVSRPGFHRHSCSFCPEDVPGGNAVPADLVHWSPPQEARPTYFS